MKLDVGSTKYSKEERVEFRRALNQWGKTHQRNFPWRINPTPYESFIATFMLQKTQASKVLRAYEELTFAFPSFSSLSKADLSDVERIFEPLGLTKRAKYLKEAAAQICKQFRGELPSNRIDLLSLKGVGDYTANAVLCFAFGKPYSIVDGAIARLLRRVFQLPAEREAWEDKLVWGVAEEFLNPSDPRGHNYALLDLSTTVCTVRNPEHEKCPLKRMCKCYQEGGNQINP